MTVSDHQDTWMYGLVTLYGLVTSKLPENTFLTTVFCVIALTFSWLLHRRFVPRFCLFSLSSSNLPPGPLGLPIVGVLHKLSPAFGGPPHLTIQAWWKRYGDVMSFKMGSRRVVVVSGLDAMRECFVTKGHVFEGRPDSYLKKMTKGKGLVFTEGETWREHRRFAISCLRDFGGSGRPVLETKIREETRYLLQEMAAHDGRPYDPADCIIKAVSNIICSIIYGARFEYTDKVFKSNLDALQQSVRKQSLIGLINFFPILELLPKIMPVDRMLERNVRMRDDYAHAQLDEHRGAFDADSPRDFIDAYMARMYGLRASGQPTTLDDSHLKRTIQDLFIAGTEPITATLRWALLFMATHQDIQLNVQQEIDRVIGPGRLPSTKDRSSLPYTEATVMESQRLGNIALFNVPRAALEETTLMGYHIPRGTWVFANRWGLHMSSRYWSEPEVFKPERFINEDGSVKRHEALYPWGMGSRSCVGESLARVQLFVFFSSILQVFTISLPPDQPMPSFEPEQGLNMSPKAYKLIVKHR